MLPITIIMGRATSDPVIQKAQNSGTEYTNLDFAVTQRGQGNEDETVYYQCYFNSFLTQRLTKAGVKKGTALIIYGDLELHPFMYQKGQRAGQAGVSAKITVKDWNFTLSNSKPENSGTHSYGIQPLQGNPVPAGGRPATPGIGYQSVGMPGNAQQNAGGTPNAVPYAMQNGYVNNMASGTAIGTNPQMGSVPYGRMPGASNNFANIPESMADQLPFPN